MVKVMVTDDDKKIFEQEGELFVGAVLHNGGDKAFRMCLWKCENDRYH